MSIILDAACIATVAEKIAGAERVLLMTHRSPDADGIGSMVALASLIRGHGKRATLYSPDLVPRHLKWLPCVDSWILSLNPDTRYDLTVVVDCGDRKLLGDSLPPAEVSGAVIAIDHHASAAPFGDFFFCDPLAAATGVLIARVADELGWQLTPESAVALWLSIVSDTGSFRYSNTNAEVLALGARLVADHGVEPWDVSRRVSEEVPMSRYRLLAHCLANVEIAGDGAIALVSVTDAVLAQCGARWSDTDGLANYTRSISGVECGVL